MRGYTLIELLIVIAIVAILSAAAVPSLNSVTGANVRSAASELAAGARYLFDTASLRHRSCRLALDLDGRSWWAECEQDRAPASPDGASPDEEPGLSDRFPDEQDGEKRKLLAKTKFGQFSDRLARKRKLPGSANFVEVWSEHVREPVTKGMAYVYFYAQGQAEAARIPIAEGDHVYSVVTQPFTGRARVVTGKPEVPRT
ncbi:MAG TPA: type II secretion system protein [Anaeromyxobacteraceae bacterium]|nr:type II secretion system protein [Anaeromyxobacteraceae bacterium]